MTTLYDCRDAFVATLLGLAAADPDIVVVVNDSVGSSKLTEFKKQYPDRLINVGIAEQNMVGVAAGLANGGCKPFVCAASPFLTGRALEQIKVDVAYSESNVKLVGMSPGLAYGPLGPTHHSIEDLAWLRAIANLTIVVPADPAETKAATLAAAADPGPWYLRISRMPVPSVHPVGAQFNLGRATMLRDGRDVTIVAMGTLVHRAIEAADLLIGDGISARVLNMSSLKPFDHQAVLAAAEETGAIVTVEEAVSTGGLGGAVAETLSINRPTPLRTLGVPGVFAPTGSTEWLFDYFGLTAEGIRTAATEVAATSVR